MKCALKYPALPGKWLTIVAFLISGGLHASPIISEFMASNDAAIIEGDGDYSDWIEIHSPDAAAVDLAGWHLTDKVTSLTQWTFPAVTIPAGGYLVVVASSQDRAVVGGELHSNFKLSAGGEYLALVMPDGVTTTSVFNEYPAQFTDYSFGIPQKLQMSDQVVDEGAPLRYHVPSGPVSNLNTAAFEARHGTTHPVAGAYTGMLNNAGDQIILKDKVLDTEFLNFSYDDVAPWPTQADGDGYSLVLKQAMTNPDHGLASNWRGSASPSGMPGGSDVRPPFAGGPDDDADADGVPALVEHFLGTSDQDSNQGRGRYAMGSAVTLPGDGLDYPTFEVTYAIGADDVVGRVDWSDTLLSWGQSMVLVSDVPNGDGTATMVWRSTHSTAVSPQFFRLNVVLP